MDILNHTMTFIVLLCYSICLSQVYSWNLVNDQSDKNGTQRLPSQQNQSTSSNQISSSKVNFKSSKNDDPKAGNYQAVVKNDLPLPPTAFSTDYDYYGEQRLVPERFQNSEKYGHIALGLPPPPTPDVVLSKPKHYNTNYRQADTYADIEPGPGYSYHEYERGPEPGPGIPLQKYDGGHFGLPNEADYHYYNNNGGPSNPDGGYPFERRPYPAPPPREEKHGPIVHAHGDHGNYNQASRIAGPIGKVPSSQGAYNYEFGHSGGYDSRDRVEGQLLGEVDPSVHHPFGQVLGNVDGPGASEPYVKSPKDEKMPGLKLPSVDQNKVAGEGSVDFAQQLANGQQVLRPQTIVKEHNGITENPHIVCHERSIVIQVKTKAPYVGRIYVNGMSERPLCIRRFKGERGTHANIEIPIGGCGMQAASITAPKSGVEYNAPVVVSFHPELLTESDRVLHVSCRYFQADQSIGSFYEVGLLPTVMLTSAFPTPRCTYSLHARSADGPAAQFARIGDPIYHRWQCDTDMYAMKLRSCYVTDGSKRRYQLLDDKGCALDHVVLPDITYEESLQSAWVKTHVFKFADRPHVYFHCEIELCIKSERRCILKTPPKCNYETLVTRRPPFINEGSPLNRKQRSVPETLAPSTTTEENDSDHMESETNTGIIPTQKVSPEKNDSQPDETTVGKLNILSPSLYVLDVGEEKKLEDYMEIMRTSAHCSVSGASFIALLVCNLVTLMIASILGVLLCRRPLDASAIAQKLGL